MSRNEGKKAYECSADTEGYRVVQLVSGKVLHNTAVATTVVLGFSQYPVAAGEFTNVDMINLPGSTEVTADGAITAGAKCFAAADGMVQALPAAAGTYRELGVALVAAADGDIFEMMPIAAPLTTVVT